jgi:hypothetical protein
VTTSTGTYAFEVISATPEQVQDFDANIGSASGGPSKLSDQIRQQLRSQKQQEALTAFGDDFSSYWTNLTQCNSDYLVEGCDNFNGGGPTCDPDKLGQSQTGQPSQGCPAPVFASCQEGSAATGGQAGQLQCTGTGPSPNAPGTFDPFSTAAGGSPQGPHPAGESATPSVPTGIGGLPGG